MKKDTLSLPVTRKALFLDVIKNRFGLLFKTGLLLTLFFLPIIIVSLIFDQMVANIYANNAYIVDGLLNEAGSTLYQSISLYRYLSLSIAIIIFSIGLSGVIRIYRQVCWSEGVLFWDCFKIGVKQNVKNYIVYAIIFDILFLALKLSEVYSPYLVIVVVILTLIILFFLPILIMMSVYSSIYNASFLRQLKNCTLLALKNYPYMLLLSFLFGGLLLLSDLPYWMILIKQAIYIIAMLLIVPIFILLVFNMLNYIFDKDVNQQLHPEMLRKGLY